MLRLTRGKRPSPHFSLNLFYSLFSFSDKPASLRTASAEEAHHNIDDLLQRLRLQCGNFRDDEIPIGGEEFARTGIAKDSQRPSGEAGILHLDCPGVTVRLACHLAQNPVAPASVSKHHSRTQFCLRSPASSERESSRPPSGSSPEWLRGVSRRSSSGRSSGTSMETAHRAWMCGSRVR